MTKSELANRILMLLGVNTRTASASPEEIQDVLKYLNDWMMANDAVGRRLGWTVGEVPADDAGIPDWAVLGVTNSVAP